MPVPHDLDCVMTSTSFCRKRDEFGADGPTVRLKAGRRKPRGTDVARKSESTEVMGDGTGAVQHVFERDCSVQLRNQKMVEVCPARDINPDLRKRITDAAVAAQFFLSSAAAQNVSSAYASGFQDCLQCLKWWLAAFAGRQLSSVLRADELI